MNGNFNSLSRVYYALAGWILLAGLAIAQPPTLMHYQGRLTNSSGNPITTAQTVYFSLWRDSSASGATTANAGTQIFREYVTIVPGANGVFDHLLGSGVAVVSTLSASLFNTATPIYLQVEIGSPLTALLPRARITSVGYAFYASQAATAAQAGTPRVTAVTDKTGGNVVVGDLLQIDGSGLSGAKVTIGGRTAPIVSASDTRLTCQVPAGVPMGYNLVAVIDAANSLASVAAAHINVHRLLVWVTPGGNPQIHIVDALTRQIVTQFSTTNYLGTEPGGINRLQMAFANEGSLAIVPSNSDGSVYAIDLTANPPSLIGGGKINTSNVTRASAVAVSPDNFAMVISDVTNNRLSVYRLGQTMPPYDTTALGNWVSTLNSNAYYTLAGPRGSAFIGNGLFVVCSSGNNRLIAFRRIPGTTTLSFTRPIGMGVTIPNDITTGNTPFMIQPTRDLTRLYVMTRGAANLLKYLVAPEGFSSLIGEGGVGSNAWGVGIAPEGNTLMVADADKDLLHVVSGEPDLDLVGSLENRNTNYNTFNYQLATMEPVEGRQLAVGTDTTRLYFFSRDGGTLALQDTNPVTLSGSNRVTYELQYQP